jgi:hypothetical protein
MHHAGSAEARPVRFVEDSRAHVAGIAMCVIQKGSQVLGQLLAQRARQSIEIPDSSEDRLDLIVVGQAAKEQFQANDPLME